MHLTAKRTRAPIRAIKQETKQKEKGNETEKQKEKEKENCGIRTA